MLRNQISLFELANFPKPPALHSLNRDLTSDVGGLLADTYKMLQFAAVHLHSTGRDENAYEGDFVDEMDEVQRGPNGLQRLMCALNMAMNHTGTSVDRELTAIDVTPIGDSSRRSSSQWIVIAPIYIFIVVVSARFLQHTLA